MGALDTRLIFRVVRRAEGEISLPELAEILSYGSRIGRSIVRANSVGWAVTSDRLVDCTGRLSGSLVTGSNKLTKPSALANDRVDVAKAVGIFREGSKLIDLDAGKRLGKALDRVWTGRSRRVERLVWQMGQCWM